MSDSNVSGSGADDLTVVILSYGHEGEFSALVDDLIEVHGLLPEQIRVAHNPFDAADTWTPAVPEGVGLVRLADNQGYAGGMNTALREPSVARWHLLLTHDARLEPGVVTALLRAGRRHPRIGVVGPVLSLPDGTTWSSGVTTRSGIARHLVTPPPRDGPVDRDSLDGTILLVRSELVREIGGFDERFFMYWEETEFCLRARRARWRVVIAPDAHATTRPGSPRRQAVHAYLLTRNGLAFAWADARWLGLAHQGFDTLKRCVWSVPHPLRARWRDRPGWQITADRTFGAALGALDFVRGRWGKPPAAVRRRSDVS